MPNYDRHLFVCTNLRADGHPRGSCAAKGSEKIRLALKAGIAQLGLDVRANSAGCLDQCEHGPTIVVYPEGTWYGGVTLDDVDEIVRRHLGEGEVVERLRLVDDV